MTSLPLVTIVCSLGLGLGLGTPRDQDVGRGDTPGWTLSLAAKEFFPHLLELLRGEGKLSKRWEIRKSRNPVKPLFRRVLRTMPIPDLDMQVDALHQMKTSKRLLNREERTWSKFFRLA